MNRLQAALREKYGTPEKALEALGLPPALLAADGDSDVGPLTTALMRTPKMAKLSSTAQMVRAALTGYLRPMLAADAAMPDLTPAVVGITSGNLGKYSATVWARAKAIVKPVLAQDAAGPDDVALELIKMMGGGGGAEDPAAAAAAEPTTSEANQTRDVDPAAAMVTEPNAAAAPPAATQGEPVKKPEDPDAEDGEGEAEILKMLGEKLGGDAELAKACYDIMKGGAKDEVTSPAAETPATNTAVDRPAKDEEAPMLKPAMDAAIKTAVTQAKADMREEARQAQEARQFVRPWVGEVSVSFDTAEEIFKHTLQALGVSTKGVHPSAYRPIIENMPRPGSHQQLAQDGALPRGKVSGDRRSDLGKMFPGAAKIKVLG